MVMTMPYSRDNNDILPPRKSGIKLLDVQQHLALSSEQHIHSAILNALIYFQCTLRQWNLRFKIL